MLRKFFKYFFYLIGAIVALILILIIYDKYESSIREKEQAIQDKEREQSELNFHTFFMKKVMNEGVEEIKWEWADQRQDIQIAHSDAGTSILRRVHLNDQYAIYVSKDENYNFHTWASFKYKCEPKTTIKTNQKYESGEFMTLTCDGSGESLYIGTMWPANTTTVDWIWAVNLGGFNVYENFSDWNFNNHDREITLKKAMKPKDGKFDQSTAKPVEKNKQ